MLLNIKAYVCVSVCVCVRSCGIVCLWQHEARVTYLPDIRHTLSVSVCVSVSVRVCVSRILSLLLSILGCLTRPPA